MVRICLYVHGMCGSAYDCGCVVNGYGRFLRLYVHFPVVYTFKANVGIGQPT